MGESQVYQTEQVDFVFKILFKNKNMRNFENDSVESLKKGLSYSSKRFSKNLWLEKIDLSQNALDQSNYKESILETIIKVINTFGKFDRDYSTDIGDHAKNKSNSSILKDLDESCEGLNTEMMAKGTLKLSVDEGLVHKILKMKNGTVVKLTCKILRMNKLIIFSYETIDSILNEIAIT